MKNILFRKLKSDYSAVNVESREGNTSSVSGQIAYNNIFIMISLLVSPDKPEEDPNFTVVKVVIHNEIGSLNRILKAFHVSCIQINPLIIIKRIILYSKSKIFAEQMHITKVNETLRGMFRHIIVFPC